MNENENIPVAKAVQNPIHALAIPENEWKNIISGMVKQEIAKQRTTLSAMLIKSEHDIYEKCISYIDKKVPEITARKVENYLNIEFKPVVLNEIGLLFESFVRNNEIINSKLQEHSTFISDLINKTRGEFLSEFMKAAEFTSTQMARTDKFGAIYKAIQTETRDHILTEANSIKMGLIEEIHEDLKVARSERDKALTALNESNTQYQEMIASQQKFKYMAISGCVMGFVGLGSALISLVNSSK